MRRNVIQVDPNQLYIAVSPALDRFESGLAGCVHHHSRRVALTALRMAQLVWLDPPATRDLVIAALLHDIGLSGQAGQNTPQHVAEGCRILHKLPDTGDAGRILAFQHEHYDGSGLLGVSGARVPLASQLLGLADAVESRFELAAGYTDRALRFDIRRFVTAAVGTRFSPEAADAFEHLAQRMDYWYELTPAITQRALCLRTPAARSRLDTAALRKSVRLLAEVAHGRANGESPSGGRKTPLSLARSLGLLGLTPDTCAALCRRDRRWREARDHPLATGASHPFAADRFPDPRFLTG